MPATASPIRPAPGSWPLVGHSAALKRDPLGLMRSLRSCGEITRIRIGPRSVYVLNEPELVHEVLVRNSRNFDKGLLFDKLRSHLGNGLVTSTGEFHHRQRRLAQPAFHARRIAAYARVMTDEAAGLVRRWEPGRPLEMTGEINDLVMAILLNTLFVPLPEPEVLREIGRWLSTRQEAMKRALSARVAWAEVLAPIGRRRAADRGDRGGASTTDLQDALGGLVRRRRAHLHDGDEGGDLLSVLLAVRHPATGERMSDEQVCDELLTLFVAGTGTVSAALAWTFHEMASRPEVRRRLESEADAVLAGRPATADDVNRLEYTRRVLHEVLRTRPVWLLMRRATAPVRLGDVELAPGDEVFFSPYAIHHDPALYPEPDRFDPDRWLPQRRAGVPRSAFLPFGAGKRLCIGEEFAWTEMTIVVATVAGRWRLEPVAGSQVRTRVGTVQRPARLQLVPTLRHG